MNEHIAFIIILFAVVVMVIVSLWGPLMDNDIPQKQL